PYFGDVERMPCSGHELMDEIGRRVIFGPPLQLAHGKARSQCRHARRGESPYDAGGGSKARGAVAGERPAEGGHEVVEGQVARPARHSVIGDIDEAARLEAPIDKPAQSALALLVYPSIDAVRDDVIELRQFKIYRGCEIGGMKTDIRDCGFRGQPARV